MKGLRKCCIIQIELLVFLAVIHADRFKVGRGLDADRSVILLSNKVLLSVYKCELECEEEKTCDFFLYFRRFKLCQQFRRDSCSTYNYKLSIIGAMYGDKSQSKRGVEPATESTTAATQPVTVFSSRGSIYAYNGVPLNRVMARIYCNGIGANLASIYAPEDLLKVASVLPSQNPSSFVWLGGKKSGTEWTWLLKSNITWFNWAPGFPESSLRCLLMCSDPLSKFYLTWKNEHCLADEHGFVCEF